MNHGHFLHVNILSKVFANTTAQHAEAIPCSFSGMKINKIREQSLLPFYGFTGKKYFIVCFSIPHLEHVQRGNICKLSPF